MVRTVRLEHLPHGVKFPDELSARISFDAERHQLRFDGFMSKTDFDKLVRLTNDVCYQRALQELFQICTFSSSSAVPAPRKWPWVVAGLSVAAFTVLATVLLLRRS